MSKVWASGAFLGLAMALFAPSALAERAGAGPGAVRKQIESSMVVTGELEITAEGTVAKLEIDKPDELPAGIVDFVRGQVSQWTFEPVMVDGKATPARSLMSVLVVGKRIDKDTATIAVRSAVFPGPKPGDDESVSTVSMKPPSYPVAAARAGVGSTVYLVLKIGRDGRVADLIVEQVNLRTVASEKNMAKLRDLFADASLRAARRWTFKPPTAGDEANEEFWLVRVPTDYFVDDGRQLPSYGKWQVYVPGPRQTIPWDEDAQAKGFSPDALASGGVYMGGAGKGLRLLTALEGG